MFEYIKSLFAKKPPVEFRHPEFGVLTHDSGVWSGKTQRDGRAIRFCVGGTDTAPNAGLLARMSAVIGGFAELERTALEFICSQEPTAKASAFTFYSLDFLWEDKRDDFVFEFTLDGDIDGIWRVEFENGQPKSLGRDD